MEREIRTIADIEAIEQTPLAERHLDPSTYAMLRRVATARADRPALIFFLTGAAYARPKRYTYGDLLKGIHQTANMLRDLGVGSTDVVSVILPNVPQTHFALWGGEAAGIVNPINPLLDPSQIVEIMNAAGTKVLITLGPFPKTDIWQKVETIWDQIPTLRTILRVDLAPFLPGWQRALVQLTGKTRSSKRPPAGIRVANFDALRTRYPADRLTGDREIRPDDIASYFHTGGTTGTPKLAQHTHANEVANTWMCGQPLDITDSDVFLCGLPLFHVNGVTVTGLLPFSRGVPVILATPAGYRTADFIANFWKIVERYHVSFFSAVPTVFSVLLRHPIGTTNVSSLRYAICGAAPMPVEVFQVFEKQTGIRILEGYGLTEGTCVSCVNPPGGDRRIGSVGYRLPYTELKTMQLSPAGDYVRDCAVDEIGVVASRGPHVFPGYKQTQHNKGVWIDDGSGRPWLNTGDMGRMDADQYLWLTGRIKELIIRGGHNIDPQAIEGPLYQHPAVALAGAVGRPDAYAGEVPVAYVTLKPGMKATPEELMAFLETHIGERAAMPKAIKIVDDLPQTAVGKIFKPDLRWKEIQEIYAQELKALGSDARRTAVNVGPDPVRGTIAHIQVTPAAGIDREALRARIAEILQRFTIPYELELV
ncbi:MAG TPA: acyl-CoA synthetase [Ktedonobacterales bacterium]